MVIVNPGRIVVLDIAIVTVADDNAPNLPDRSDSSPPGKSCLASLPPAVAGCPRSSLVQFSHLQEIFIILEADSTERAVPLVD